MKLLAVVLLLLPLSGCLAAVVTDFTATCPGFFVNPNGVVSPPTRFLDNNNPDRYKQICQTKNDRAEFATFYDTANRMPVYSAYKFEGLMDCKRDSGWYIEPQLDDPQQGGNNMKSEAGVRNAGANQALNADYDSEKDNNNRNKYDRGHLAPVFQANSQRCADATFTLTNAAPQNPSFNRGGWKRTERIMGKILDTNCTAKKLDVFVVTGVVPGNNIMNNRVRVPSHYWTAFCCIDNNNKAVHSGGFMGENREGAVVERKRVQDLENTLTSLYGAQLNHNFILFGKTCYTENEEIHPSEEKRKNKKRKCLRTGKHKFVGKSKKY